MTWRYEYAVGNTLSPFDDEERAKEWAEYLNNEHMDELKKRAEYEKASELSSGQLVTNWDRMRYKRRLEEHPVKVYRRRVTEWEELDD